MEETSEELLNFSIGIDLLGPVQQATKKKLKKTRKLHVSQIFRKREHHLNIQNPW